MSLIDGFNDRQAIDAIKTVLQANLTDPRQQYVTETRPWIHTDEPLTSATYPRIQVRKREPTTTKIICIGQDFIEQRAVIVDVQFWTSQGFKWQNTDDATLMNEEFVKEYLDKIWVTLKAQQPTLKATYEITGLKPLGEEKPYREPDRQLWTGIISIRVWYFRR